MNWPVMAAGSIGEMIEGARDRAIATGHKCRVCGYWMYAQDKQKIRSGRWVRAVCHRAGRTNQEKVFDEYIDRR